MPRRCGRCALRGTACRAQPGRDGGSNRRRSGPGRWVVALVPGGPGERTWSMCRREGGGFCTGAGGGGHERAAGVKILYLSPNMAGYEGANYQHEVMEEIARQATVAFYGPGFEGYDRRDSARDAVV